HGISRRQEQIGQRGGKGDPRIEEPPAHQKETHRTEDVQKGPGTDDQHIDRQPCQLDQSGLDPEKQGIIPKPLMKITRIPPIGAVKGALHKGHVPVEVYIEGPIKVVRGAETLNKCDEKQNHETDPNTHTPFWRQAFRSWHDSRYHGKFSFSLPKS